jgi:transposase InsO family protein
MSRQTDVHTRKEFQRLHQAGETYQEIAEKYGVSYECVRHWCRLQNKGGSPVTRYPGRKSGLLSSFADVVRYNVLKLKLKHPRWGSSRILVRMQKTLGCKGHRLPGPTQIGRYLHQWKRFRRQGKPQKGVIRPDTPTEVHQRWQLDFKMGIVIANQKMVNLHTIRDPVGEACLGAIIYPAGEVKPGCGPKKTTIGQAQNTLRRGFAKWHTLPKQVQTDHEANLVAQKINDFPTVFTLWLVGLGIEHSLIRPARPTDNAEVERCHRTINDYAIVGNEGKDETHLQKLLDQAVDELNFELPSHAQHCNGLPPVQAHPDLLIPPHPFEPEQELSVFDLARVDRYLAPLSWVRIVGKTGIVYLGSHQYSVGRSYTRKAIRIRFDPHDRQFIFHDPGKPDDQSEIRRLPVRGLSVEDLTGLYDPSNGLVPQQLPLPLVWAAPIQAAGV